MLIGLEIPTINSNLEGKATRIFFRQKMSGSFGVVEGQFDDVDDEMYDKYLCYNVYFDFQSSPE